MKHDNQIIALLTEIRDRLPPPRPGQAPHSPEA